MAAKLWNKWIFEGFHFLTVRVDVWILWNCCHDVSRCCTKCWQLVLKKSRWQTQKRIDSTQSQLFLKVFMMKYEHNHKFYQLFEQNFQGAKILRDIFNCLNRIPVFSVLHVVGMMFDFHSLSFIWIRSSIVINPINNIVVSWGIVSLR